MGGPDVGTFRDFMHEMLGVIHRRRAVVNMPFWMARIMAFFFRVGNVLSLGIVPRMITADQVENLRHDNVVGEGVLTFADLGITPTATEAILPSYLWRFRPSGQYDAIKDSAKNLRV